MIYKIEIEVNKSTFWSGDRWGCNLTKVMESCHLNLDSLMLHSYSQVFSDNSYCLKNIKKFNLDKLKHSVVFVRDLKMFFSNDIESGKLNLLRNETFDFLNYFTGDLDIYLPFYIDIYLENKWIGQLGDLFSFIEDNFDVVDFTKFSDNDNYSSISKNIIRDIKLKDLLK